jgi:hypothetical protein
LPLVRACSDAGGGGQWHRYESRFPCRGGAVTLIL